MIKKILLLALSIISLTLSSTVLAVSVPTLYQSEVPVSGHSSNDWKKSASTAFEQVLIKVSGNPKIAQNESIRRAINQASNYVQSYNYASLDMGGGKRSMSVQIRFSPKAVNDLLQQAGQTVLPKDRPVTLVWLAIENTSGSSPVLLNDSRNSIVLSLQREADKLALPLYWPTLDLTDMSAITPAQVWSLNANAAQNASRRYQADAILLGKIIPIAKDNWQAQWVLINGGANQSWQTQGNTPNAAALAMVSQFSRFILPSGANSGSAPIANTASAPGKPAIQEVTLKVSGINGLNDYSALVDYLRSLDVVSDLSVLQTQGDQLTIRVKIAGARDVLIREIGMSNQLLPQADNTAQVPKSLTTPPVLFYQWQGVRGKTSGPSPSYVPPAMRRPGSPSAPGPAVPSAPAPRNVYQQQSQSQSQYPPVIDQSGNVPDDGNQGMVQSYPMDNDNNYNSPSQVPYEVSP